jgi:GT2 family glycosyltransferase
MNWSIISATNNEAVLKSCLLNSPDAKSASETILQTGYDSAARAYNDAIEKATTDVLVFAHQDVYLPHGWLAKVEKAVEAVSRKDPNWAMMGVWGVDARHVAVGNMYCAGLMERLGQPFPEAIEVQSLDEMVLIMRRSAGVRFDTSLPGFHMYGTDICLAAKKRGMKSYVISAFCIHNTNGYKLLPWQFWKSYLFMRRKWRAELPVMTSCIEITPWCLPMIKWNILRSASMILKRHKPGKRVPDPRSLYREPMGREQAA